jgi:predicted PurR-regulated permease PerM
MRIEAKLGFWLGGLAVLALFLWLLADVLMPFAAGFAIAYLLDPVADRLERAGLNRLGATLIILIGFILVIALVLSILAPALGGQIAAFIDALPSIAARLRDLATEQGASLIARFAPLAKRLGLDIDASTGAIQGSVGDFTGDAAKYAADVLKGLWSGGRALIGLVSLLVVTPVVAFYILLDWDRMLAKIDSWVPLDQRDTVRDLASQIDTALSGFLRGQSLVCLFLATWYGLGLSLIGLNYGLLIGVASGVLSFVPYVGSLICLVLAVGVSLVQGWPSLTLLGLAMAVIVTGQFLEGNVLTPKLVGESVGLHPVWLMLALLAFGSLFGFTGLLLAVPISAAVGVLMRFALRNYLASPLYLGSSGSNALTRGTRY